MASLERTKPGTTAVIVVDVQEKLIPTLPEARVDDIRRSARILLGAARELESPVLWCEQYPRGLGPTDEAVATELRECDVKPLEKLTFSAAMDPGFNEAWAASGADAAVVLGIEAHICVFQTVRDLLERGVRVDVVIDGVASRRDDHRQTGLRLCERAGANLTTSETVLFEWLVEAGTDRFKRLSRLVR
ncbi:MAG: isochorismatase family protein [Myxococcota bacterium]